MAQSEKFRKIQVALLELDDHNPRLPKSLHGSSANEIISYLLREASTLELMQAIGENGYFEGEQLLVVPLKNGKYKVVEGNRRLTSIMLLNNYKLASVKKDLVKKVSEEAVTNLPIKEVPCLVFDKEEEIRKYLGYRHVTGIKSWGLSEKARYLSELYKSNFSHLTFSKACYELAKTIGSTKSYILRVLTAFRIFEYIEDEGYFKIKDLDDTNFFVGYYSDGISRQNISKFLGVEINSEDPLKNFNKKNVELLTRWFYEKFEIDGRVQTRLKGKSGDLNDLNTILGHEVACDAFVNNGYTLQRAKDLAEDYENIFYKAMRTALLNLETADRTTQYLTNFYDGLKEDLVQIRKLTTKINSAKEEFENKGFDTDEL